MRLQDIQPGDVLKYWHDAGCMGAELCFAQVLKVAAKKVRVRGERGEEGWKYPEFFTGKATGWTPWEASNG